MKGENLGKKGKEKKGERKSKRKSSNRRSYQTNPKIFHHLFKKKITNQKEESDRRGRKKATKKIYLPSKCQKRYGEAAKNCGQHRIERVAWGMSNAKNFSHRYQFVTISIASIEVGKQTDISKKGYKENSKTSKKKDSFLKGIFKYKN